MSFARLATLLIFPLADFRGRWCRWCRCLPLRLLLPSWSSLLLLLSSQLLRFRSVSVESLPSPNSSSSVSSDSVPSPSFMPAAVADLAVSTAAGFLSCSSSWTDGADADADDADDEHVEDVDEMQRKPAVVVVLVVCSIIASPSPLHDVLAAAVDVVVAAAAEIDDVGEVSSLHPAPPPAEAGAAFRWPGVSSSIVFMSLPLPTI
mmetsp:Transcript_25047/g.59522  ORF Transcript_25047/g.59522 Transcript_25047/m.59522 type:complete len:205 (-) Transcript_25047:436-1050(-)